MDENAEDVGVRDKVLYYDASPEQEQGRTTIAETILYDTALMIQKKKEGLDVSLLKRFLIGGCFSPRSIQAMVEFIQGLEPQGNVQLLVTDINKEAFEMLKSRLPNVPPNIHIELFQGDLTALGLASNSIDYIRMDYTQNFVPFEKQAKLLKEMKRVLTDKGLGVAVERIMPAAEGKFQQILRKLSKVKGSAINTDFEGKFGMRLLIPTEELVIHAAKEAKLQLDRFMTIGRPSKYNKTYLEDKFVVYTK
jgi:SAM-dependent methyltransferase